MSQIFDDNPESLPPHLRKVYQNPHKTLGLDPEETTTKAIRDAFRRAALGNCSYFWGLAKPKASMEVILFAYHLLRRNIVGPAQDIKAGWHKNSYMDFRPEDLVPTLKPLQGQVDIPRVYRGFRNLNIKFLNIDTSFDLLTPKFKFVFSVHYCMRKHTIEKTIDELKSFYDDVRNELLCIPEFPSQLQGISYISDIIYGLGLTSRDEMGHSLAKFIQRLHDTLAAGGNFSPRVFHFLKIDYERVQSEEAGAVMSVLDTLSLPRSSCWYMVNEAWLAKWRRFAMGRGPRRYLAPGPVDNDKLKKEALAPGKKWLDKVVHYRAVNCNVWMYYVIVHGGGPSISRMSANIYSPFATSYLQGVINIQSKIRSYLAKKKLDYLYMENLSKCRAAKELLAEEKALEKLDVANAVIHEESQRRLNFDMIAAAQLTQALWRKVNSSIPEEKLKMALQDEKVFARARKAERGTAAAPSKSVVKEMHPVVQIGETGLYNKTVADDQNGIPFKIQKTPWSEDAIIVDTINDNFEKNSRLIAINGHPTMGMKYEMVKEMLGNSPKPLDLKFQRPPSHGHIMFLDELLSLKDPELQYASFKLLLSRQFYLVRHSYSYKTRRALDSVGLNIVRTGLHKPYLSAIILSETHLHLQNRFDVSKLESDLWKSINLYNINHIKTGHEIDFLKKQSGVDKDHAFAIVMNSGKEFIFEIPFDGVRESYLKDIEDQKAQLLEDRKRSLAMQGEQVEEDILTQEQIEHLSHEESVRSDMSLRRKNAAQDLHSDDALAKLATAGGNPHGAHSHQKKVKKRMGIFSAFKRQPSENEPDAAAHLFHNAKAGIFIRNMKKLRNEIQESQQYIDTDGVPIIRRNAKSSLRKVR